MPVSFDAATLRKILGGSVGVGSVMVTKNQSPALLAQILQGVQAGSTALTSFYQGQAAVNQARYEAEQARYGGGYQQPGGYVQGGVQAGVSGSQDLTPLLLLGGALMLVMMMSRNDRSR
jgi:hypothetical protein